MIDPTLISLATAVFAGGAAWGGAKRALNGSRERIKGIDAKLDKHIAETTATRIETADRLARIETRIQ